MLFFFAAMVLPPQTVIAGLLGYASDWSNSSQLKSPTKYTNMCRPPKFPLLTAGVVDIPLDLHDADSCDLPHLQFETVCHS